MKKKDLYKLVKQSLKEVLQEQRRDQKPERLKRLSSLEIARIVRDAGLSSRQFSDVLRKANLNPTDAERILPTLSVQQINDLIKSPSDFILPMSFTTNCETITDYGTATIYINDPVNVVLMGTVGGEIGNSGCQEIEINDSFICCSSNNPTDDGLVGGGNMSYAYDGSPTVWSQWSPGATNCLDLPDTGGVSSFTYQQFIDWYVQQSFSYTDLGDQYGEAYAGAYLSSVCGIPGCIDPIATNYNESANADDGSCEYVEGCMDEAAFNFDLDAVLDDGSCQFEGCSDESADNTGITVTPTLLDDNDDLVYANASVSTNPIYTDEEGNASAAAQNDALCIYPILGCMDEAAFNFNPDAELDNGSCQFEGCSDESADNTGITVTPTLFDESGDLVYANASVSTNPTYTDEEGNASAAVQDTALCTYTILGCQDENALNYNPDATAGSNEDYCNYTVEAIPGCIDPAAINYNVDATADNGSCRFEGCTDPNASNTNALAPGVTPTEPPYTNSAIAGYDADNYPDEDSQNLALCTYPVEGCMDEAAINYDEDATIDDGSCIFEGCTDPNASNFNALTVTPTTTSYTISAIAGYNAASYPDGEADQNIALCTYPIEGCMDNTAVNYNPDATTGNVSDFCQYSGCMDDTAANYDPDAILDDNTYADVEEQNTAFCQYAGCTDPTNSAFDITAVWNVNLYASEQAQNQALCDNDSDGILNMDEVPGCMNPLASNYDENATDDDGSCTFNYCSDGEYDNYVCIVEPSLCIDPTQGNLACGDGVNDTPCPDGIFNTALGEISADLDFCTGENVFCPDPLAINGPTEDISEQNITQTEDYSTCIYEFCNDDNAYNYSDVRPDGDQWILNQDIPNNNLCEYVGCADNTYDGYEESFGGDVSTEYPSPLSPITLYYYNGDNDGCEIDTSIGFGSGNGIEPTGNLSSTNTSCCPGGKGAEFGCTDDGNLGQQYWSLTQQQGANYPVPYSNRTDISNLVASHTAISSYPGVSATNVNPDAAIDDGSCKYNIGCMDPESVTYDPNAEIEDNRLCRYCKDIVAVQCNPDPDPNGYYQDFLDSYDSLDEQIGIDKINKFKEPRPPKPSKSGFTYQITRACVTIGGQMPEVGDEFLAQGVQYISAGVINEDENIEFETCCCPPGVVGGNPYTTNVAAPPGCAGFGCQSGPCGEETIDKAPSVRPGRIDLTAAFRVTQVMNHSTTVVTDLSPWQCSKRPPVSVGNLGVGDLIDADKLIQGPRPRINEVKISKKLRKSLKESLYGISPEDKLRKLIKNTLKNKK